MNTPNFSDIYTLYFEDVYKYLLALCHDEELAEELKQLQEQSRQMCLSC